MRIILAIRSNWIFSGTANRGSTIRLTVRALEKKYGPDAETKKSDMCGCEIIWHGQDTAQEAAAKFRAALEEVTSVPYDGDVFTITVDEDGALSVLGKDGGLTPKQAAVNDVFAQLNAMRAAKKDKPESAPAEKPAPPERRPDPPAEPKPGSAPVPETPKTDSVQEKTEAQDNNLPHRSGEEAGKKENVTEAEAAEAEKTGALEQIHNLVGCAGFKALADDVSLTAEYTIQNKTQGIFFSETYLFSIDTGSGYHTSLALFSRLLSELNLFSGAVPTDTIVIPAFTDKELTVKMANAIEMLKSALQKQRVLCIDLTEWIGHTGSRELKKLLMTVFRGNDQCAVVFRVPYVKTAILTDIVNDLEDIVSVRPVVFEPFTDEELREVADRYLAKHGFDLSEEAWEIFRRRIQLEKANGYFYGVHTVHKVIGDIIRKKELLAAKQGKADRHVTEEIEGLIETAPEEEERDHLEDLRAMIGMESITEQMVSFINQIVFARSKGLKSQPTMHMCFVGNPGTGKTTVARIMGQVLKDRGVLRIGKFFEHHARDLCGEYVGQTAPKTHAICEEAYGSVLFLDEAYSLASDSGFNHDYGKEAIDTLIAEMENHGDDLVVVLAGYPDDIERMISLNPGMRSRIPYTLTFPSYTPDQLAAIFEKMLTSSFSCTDDLMDHVREFFQTLPEEMLSDKAFGNGRFVRNLFERTWGKAIARNSENGYDSLVINTEDFDAAVRELNLSEQKPSNRTIGFR